MDLEQSNRRAAWILAGIVLALVLAYWRAYPGHTTCGFAPMCWEGPAPYPPPP